MRNRGSRNSQGSRRRNRKLSRKQRAGGTLKRLPISAKTASDLKKDWIFTVIGAHGSLDVEHVFTVPANTYIIFNSPSGCRAISVGPIPYSELLVDDRESFYDNIFDEIGDPKTLLATYNTANSACGAGCAELGPGFYEKGKLSMSTAAPTLTKAQKSRAIYAPGTVTFDMDLQFSNNLDSTLLLGVYTLPLSKDLPSRLRVSVPANAESKKRANSAMFSADIGNLFPDLIGTSEKLSKVLARLPSVAAGKNRLIFVTSCRGVEDVSPVTRPVFTRLVRTVSLGQRENANPANASDAIPLMGRIQNTATKLRTGIYDPAGIADIAGVATPKPASPTRKT
jgi:hypothetical protein